jgi:hypothetical protein
MEAESANHIFLDTGLSVTSHKDDNQTSATTATSEQVDGFTQLPMKSNRTTWALQLVKQSLDVDVVPGCSVMPEYS